MMMSRMCFEFNLMQVCSDFDEKAVMRNMSFMSMEPNFGIFGRQCAISKQFS